jgi:gluconate kinase
MKLRKHHFMKADMLKSQFATLEEPRDAFVVDASLPIATIVSQLTDDVKTATVKTQ